MKTVCSCEIGAGQVNDRFPSLPMTKITQTKCFLSIFILIGAVIIFFGVRVVIHAYASSGWPKVGGKVVSSSVESKRGNKGGVTYHAEVLYEYSVADQTYSSDTIAFGEYGSSDPARARKIVNRYPPRSGVVVYYAPDDPSKSVLEVGVSAKTFFLTGFGLIFFCVGLGMFIFMPAQMRKSIERAQEKAKSSVSGQ